VNNVVSSSSNYPGASTKGGVRDTVDLDRLSHGHGSDSVAWSGKKNRDELALS
jgi:hypothetical protein